MCCRVVSLGRAGRQFGSSHVGTWLSLVSRRWASGQCAGVGLQPEAGWWHCLLVMPVHMGQSEVKRFQWWILEIFIFELAGWA
ncbi:hypothetical protein NPIL_443391 [Nephila pilipes]|uniref:Uncharacterized protein n=1 Tax=Nephila pilipes TaxID=299642 RepID=A0A8X6TD80_NEPPI|nr:hypothetical protein NPIL_443391 [Nephila pilipes]